MTSTERNKAVVRRFNKEVIEGQQTQLMEELFQADFINHTVRPGFSPGPDGMLAFLQILWNAFSELRVDIQEQVAEGDLVTSRKTISGRHTGPFMNLAASQKMVEIRIMDMVRLKEGKYAEHWSVIDMQGLIARING